MRKIIVSTFVTMDGVLQAPGGPQEDITNDFKWGGWSFHYWDDVMNQALNNIMAGPFDLLLGRRTYEIFAAYWPYQRDHAIAEKFNRAEKYVVSQKKIDLTWDRSTLITGDVVAALREIKAQDGPDLLVQGSGKLIQALLENNLVDVLHTWTFPIILGPGKKLFAEGAQPGHWKVTNTIIATSGVIIASYVPGGEITIGSFVQEDVSAAELARREKQAKGMD